MPKFNVGDLVRVKTCFFHRQECSNINKISRISRVDETDGKLFYYIEGTNEAFAQDELEYALKERDIVYFRNGFTAIIHNNYICQITSGATLNCVKLADFGRCLVNTIDDAWSIIKIERPEKYTTIWEEKAIKKVTLEDVYKKFGEKVEIIKEEC